MSGAWTVALTFACAWAALGALSLAMERHFYDVLGRGRPGFGHWQPWLRAAGTAGLLLSWWLCRLAQGAAQGWVLWLGVLTAAALAQVALLSTLLSRR